MNEKVMRNQRKKQTIIFSVIIIVLTYLSANITGFNILHGIATLPEAIVWIFSNLYITQESLEKLPTILEKLIETILMSIAATTTATVVSIFLGLMGI